MKTRTPVLITLALGALTAGAAAQCDPEEIAKLIASDGEAHDELSTSVGISGDTAIAGAPGDDDGGSLAGAVYVFQDPGNGTWGEIVKLTASDAASMDIFGNAVAINGDTLMVGARTREFGDNSGSVYVFERDAGGTWNEVDKLLAPDGADNRFGHETGSLDISGDVVIIGARSDGQQGLSTGAAYVFRSDGTSWLPEQKLFASDPQIGDDFGDEVAIDGDVALIGGWGDDDYGNNAGSAYVFRFDGQSWVQEQKLEPADWGPSLGFYKVAVSGDVAVVGAFNDDEVAENAGAAYVFRYDQAGSEWIREAKLLAPDGEAGDGFGQIVQIQGDTIVVGVPDDDNANGTWAGAAYVFRYQASGQWDFVAKLVASDGQPNDFFGRSLGISHETIIAGSRADQFGEDSGSAYIFDLNCAEPGAPADITDFDFRFGSHLAGTLGDLASSDDSYLEGRSQFGFSALEPNIIDLVIGATSPEANPGTFDISIESHINNPGGMAAVRLMNWSTGTFEQIATFPTSQEDAIETFPGIDAADHVRASDNRIELSTRMSVIATFSAAGFDAFFDWMEILVN